MATGAYWIFGHLALYFWLKGRGVRVHRFFSGVPLYAATLYYWNRPAIGSRRMDVFVATSTLAMVVSLLCCVLMFPLGICPQ